jgi:hypothetical protein
MANHAANSHYFMFVQANNAEGKTTQLDIILLGKLQKQQKKPQIFCSIRFPTYISGHDFIYGR